MALPQDPHPEIAKLLRIKRFESPPPGYFHRLPDQIRARIERDDEREPRLASWWRSLLAPLRQRPSLAGANVLILAGAGLLATSLGRSLLRNQEAGGSQVAGQQPVFCYDIATAGPNLDRVLSSPLGASATAPSPAVIPASLVLPPGASPVLLHWTVNSNGTAVPSLSQPLLHPAYSVSGLRWR